MTTDYKRYYMGRATDGGREVFRAASTPTQSSHPEYQAVVGPFRTKAGATYMRDYGDSNPHCVCVSDAERLAKQINL